MVANVRFDLKEPENIEFHKKLSSYNTSVLSHLPNSSLGFSDSTTGSDILSIIENFLNINQLCGAIIHIALKRYPNSTDIDTLASRIRQNHATVNVVIPTSSSGGIHFQTMYNLASKTNGFATIARDDGYEYAENVQNLFYFYPYLVYSANANASGSGSMALADMALPAREFYYIEITVQDKGVLSTFETLHLNFTNPNDSYSLNSNDLILYRAGNFLLFTVNMSSGKYTVSFDYSYLDSKAQTLQIRVLGTNPIDYWIPYAD